MLKNEEPDTICSIIRIIDAPKMKYIVIVLNEKIFYFLPYLEIK